MTQDIAVSKKNISRLTGDESLSTRSGWKRQSQRLECLSVVLLIALGLGWFAWPLFWSASENVRMVGTFNTDEEAHVILIREAIDSRSLRLGYIQYGYAYLNMGLFPLFLLSYVTDVTDQQIIVWLRIIPALFAVATVALIFWTARRYFGRLVAWLSAFFLALAVPNWTEMSVMSHSDIPQVFFIALSICFCCRAAQREESKWLVWASAAAGAGFGCKYSGLFVLPVIGLYGLLHVIRTDQARIQVNGQQVAMAGRILAAVAGGVLLAVGFVIIPYAAAPYLGAEYFGISMPQFFAMLRLLTVAAGAGLLVLVVVPFVWAFIRQSPKLAYLLKLSVLLSVAFSVAFLLSSPFNVFSIRSGFLRGFFYESLHSSFGHSFEAEGGKAEWFGILLSPRLLGPWILGLALMSLVLVVFKLVRGGWKLLLEPDTVMWVWTLFYFVFLFWRVNIRTHRALLPIIPFVLVLAAHAFGLGVRYMTTRLPRSFAVAITFAGLLAVAGGELPRSLAWTWEFRQTTRNRVEASDAVLIGRWLAEYYPPSSRILYDPFSYVPPLFADANVTPWGGTLDMLETLEPDVVIVSSETSDRFLDPQNATAYARDEAQFMAKYEYYRALREEGVGYTLVRDLNSIQVYERK